ncbi:MULTISPECIES: PP2C family protein-serine/threonine phosphatase [Streptomycetaceae]|uniref:Magnesium or manganese-dependent protein phosphatase n=1 Tax=Streptantibioticus cattleyicolor (strain ATCC 35852 / DSM 46488 / JCM 4925 / NBRC 14057 / NRRL 8057) TaxID=1003195 RepID=F8JV34_STREN|nr:MULTISPECIES: SpoIIE family protein phosphatase [Streptomycetaceae]AEW93116.1 magnesium or manganese-dependent protein phosphatase [Streptantibioticus cattleyicolor NRRL 8057 = DSM 46488]MYS57845.1 SpoIIE family protein phosphatase [Streptomyces sp. SID5468]CCB73474.1 Magnesium or manganese-dependent protein phosphatase [Streptantibioticus cattleyicolor NRRL 8057 = DSM 46488]
MPSHLHADHSASPSPDPGAVDALISQARSLRGQVDAVRRGAPEEDDPRGRWQRALYDLAVHHLDDLGAHLDRLKQQLHEEAAPQPGTAYPPLPRADGDGAQALDDAPHPPAADVPSCPAGSAEWNLLTDGVTWSDEVYRIFGRAPADGPLTLDELPSWLLPEDQRLLTEMVTACLVDGKPIDGEVRIRRPDGSVRTIHLTGEPVLDDEGATASLWAVLRDVSELRRSQQRLREREETLWRREQAAQAERRLTVEFQETVLPPGRGPLRLPPGQDGPGLDVAAHYLPSATGALIGGDWYDALHLPDGATLLTVGDLTGHGVAATSGMAMLLGALRGMAVAGLAPGPLLARLNDLLDRSPQPVLGSALCCRYDAERRLLTWAQAGHPAPLLFRDGTGRRLTPPDGMLLGATTEAGYGEATEALRTGDLLVLHTDGLLPRPAAATEDGHGTPRELLALAPYFAQGHDARSCVRAIVEEVGAPRRDDDACVLVARIG